MSDDALQLLESGVDRLLWEVENSLSQRYESVLEEK
jgi:hypothetical protein